MGGLSVSADLYHDSAFFGIYHEQAAVLIALLILAPSSELRSYCSSHRNTGQADQV